MKYKSITTLEKGEYMKNTIKTFVILFGFFSIYFGLGELAFNNAIFSDPKSICCNNYTPSPFADPPFCSAESGADLDTDENCDKSDDIAFTVYDCVNMLSGPNHICTREGGNEYVFCTDNVTGYRYSTWYGLEVPVNALSITGEIYPIPGINYQYWQDAEDGLGNYSYQWYIYYPCNGEKARPCGYWFKTGNNSSTLSVTESRDFWLKCTVTAGFEQLNNISKDTSPIFKAYTGSYEKVNKERNENANKIINTKVIEKYSLGTNYPNPFNPYTIIKYTVNEPATVTIRVYDNLGNEIAELINAKQDVGQYEVEFNGTNLASGTYYYRMIANGYSKTRSMRLIK